ALDDPVHALGDVGDRLLVSRRHVAVAYAPHRRGDALGMVADTGSRLTLAAEVAPGERILAVRANLDDLLSGVVDLYRDAAQRRAIVAMGIDLFRHANLLRWLGRRYNRTKDNV